MKKSGRVYQRPVEDLALNRVIKKNQTSSVVAAGPVPGKKKTSEKERSSRV